MAPVELVHHIVRNVHQDRTLAPLFDYLQRQGEIHALLFANLPYIRGYSIEEKALEILEPLCQKNLPLLHSTFKELMPTPPPVLSSKDFLNLLVTVLRKVLGPRHPIDYRQQLIDVMRQKGLRPPAPLLFADTNWQKDYFAFLVSPSTLELELWRLTPTSFEGAPMAIWKHYLDGSVKHPPWGLYTQKSNYL